MTDKTMTLEQVRNKLLAFESFPDDETPMRVEYRELADAITRHLSQPAERGKAVAVYPNMARAALSYGFSRGFIAACGWPAPVTQDIHSQAFNDQCEKFVEANAYLYTAPPPAAGVPDGWKLVPIEPTHEMCSAPDAVWHPEARKIWMQMLSAAPEADHHD